MVLSFRCIRLAVYIADSGSPVSGMDLCSGIPLRRKLPRRGEDLEAYVLVDVHGQPIFDDDNPGVVFPDEVAIFPGPPMYPTQ